MNRSGTERTMSDLLSNAYHSNPIQRARDYIRKDLAFRRALRGIDGASEIKKVGESAEKAMREIASISGVELRPPKLVLAPRLSGNHKAEFDYSTNKIYMLPGNGEDLIKHELVHFARSNLRARKIMKASDRYRTSKIIMEEGVADFVNAFIDGRFSAPGEGHRFPPQFEFALTESGYIYDAVKSSTGTSEVEALNGYLQKFKEPTSKGRFKFSPYNPGNALAMVLLAANGLDARETSRQMLTNSNQNLLLKIVDSIKEDKGAIRDMLRI